MQVDDLILVSVDDHVVEPPHLFEGRLSAAAADAPWTGERGLVTEKMPALIEADTHAYLCGPPAMIDSAVVLLRRHGVARESIHADRFTTQHDGLAAAA